jgi:CubicO group peptidase (beta-lactamase class C family)
VHLRLRRRAGRGGGPAATRPPAPAASADKVCTASACISLSRLAASIDTQLKGNVAGYAALVGHSQAVASGLARTAADPPQLAMGPDVMVNVASVGKMFTTIAVLQSLARHHLSIDSRIWPFLPPDWVKGPGVDTITFRELLTHRAGFRLDSGLVFATDDAAREQIRQGVQQLDKQVADYNNIDFTIFRDMLPFMEGVPDPGPAARAAAATRFFISYVQRQVFDPVGVTDARCGPAATGTARSWHDRAPARRTPAESWHPAGAAPRSPGSTAPRSNTRTPAASPASPGHTPGGPSRAATSGVTSSSTVSIACNGKADVCRAPAACEPGVVGSVLRPSAPRLARFNSARLSLRQFSVGS